MPDTYLTGGERLKDKLAEIAQRARTAASVKIGFLAGATYPDGTSVPMVAAIQEFGAPSKNIPPRPFFRDMIAEKSPEWPDAIARLLVRNNYDAAQTLGQVGEAVAGQLRQSIVDLTEPPLADATIRRKGFSKPLIDTGHMLASVSYEVTGEAGSATYADPGMTGTYTAA